MLGRAVLPITRREVEQLLDVDEDGVAAALVLRAARERGAGRAVEL